ncbi:hypothetical protein K438DRAFT_1958723 [Mycena galopus ATCC 62051]|nr:hypothetical protein K438DRAFT_1958723 [Mycena galopus ATCC 62051]
MSLSGTALIPRQFGSIRGLSDANQITQIILSPTALKALRSRLLQIHIPQLAIGLRAA